VAQLFSLGIITRMSQRDLQQNRATLIGFKGRPCFASLHANAIRFRFDDIEKQGHYIWIDHPWVFSRDTQEITTSYKYSEDTKDALKEWCSLFGAVRETILLDFEEGEHGEITLVFSDGYRLFVPLDPESDDLESDYDHWYAHDA
jgi:hypothetical protein